MAHGKRKAQTIIPASAVCAVLYGASLLSMALTKQTVAPFHGDVTHPIAIALFRMAGIVVWVGISLVLAYTARDLAARAGFIICAVATVVTGVELVVPTLRAPIEPWVQMTLSGLIVILLGASIVNAWRGRRGGDH